MIVFLLTEDEKNKLVGNHFTYNAYFNPVQDADNNWIITSEEIDQCDISEFMWVKNLPMIEYKPVNGIDIT
jgi:hypothetical protein